MGCNLSETIRRHRSRNTFITAAVAMGSRIRTLLALSAAVLAGHVHAAQASRPLLLPSSAYAQWGAGEHTRMHVIGATWDWGWRKDFAWGHATGYWDASIGRWSSEHEGTRSSAWVTQLGVTPVLRLHPASWAPGVFLEGGIGVNVLNPIYRNRDKRFSTRFNFGDHLALGWQFGVQREHEVALRLQHFSNAGIKKPNPGENFVQLRYAYRF